MFLFIISFAVACSESIIPPRILPIQSTVKRGNIEWNDSRDLSLNRTAPAWHFINLLHVIFLHLPRISSYLRTNGRCCTWSNCSLLHSVLIIGFGCINFIMCSLQSFSYFGVFRLIFFSFKYLIEFLMCQTCEDVKAMNRFSLLSTHTEIGFISMREHWQIINLNNFVFPTKRFASTLFWKAAFGQMPFESSRVVPGANPQNSFDMLKHKRWTWLSKVENHR